MHRTAGRVKSVRSRHWHLLVTQTQVCTGAGDLQAAGRFGRVALPWQCSYPGPVACAHPIFPSAPAIRATMPAQTTPDLSTLVKGLPSLQPTAHIGYL